MELFLLKMDDDDDDDRSDDFNEAVDKEDDGVGEGDDDNIGNDGCCSARSIININS
ncbi:hypothetical protein D3C80_2033320 [compost metagenome]